MIDIRGGNRAYYLRAFGEEFGRDDQYINIVGGGYGVWKASLYNNDIPHNYSFNALTPLAGAGGTLLVGPGLPYPQSPNPAAWNSFNYGTQRNLWGGNAEFSNKTPWFIRADYNEVTMNGVKPGSGQLGTGSGNGLIEFGVPVDYKTKNTTIEGGYNSRQYGFKLAYINSKFTDANDTLQWTNFYMRSGLDYSLLPPDNELKKWSFNGYIKQLPWDSAIIARFTQSKLTNSFGIAGTGLKPTGNTPSGQFIPPGVGNLLTQPYDASSNQNLSTFNGDQKRTTVNVAWNANPLPELDTRVYYDYYDLQNDSTNVSYRQGSQGSNCATPPANSPTCYQIGALVAPENFQYTKNSAGFDAAWAFNRYNKLLGGFDWYKVDRDLEPAPKTDDYRYWIEYRNTGGWENVTGRLKYEYWQRRSDIDHSQTYNSTNVQPTTVPYYFSPYDVSNFDRNVVKFTLDWTPAPLWFVGLGGTWRETDYKENFYGRVNDKSQQYDATLSWGDDRLRITAIGNWGKVKFEQDYRNVGSRRCLSGSAAQRPDEQHQLQLEHQQQPGRLDGRGGGRLGAGGQVDAQRELRVREDQRGRRLLVGEHPGCWRLQRRAARQLRHRQHDTAAVPDQGDIRRQQELGDQRRLRVREVQVQRRPDGGLLELLPVLPEPRPIEHQLVHGRVRQPELHDESVLDDGDVQVRPAAGPGAHEGCGGAARRRRHAVTAATPPPPPPPPPPARTVQKITLDSKVLFDFDKAVLKPEGKAAIDSQVVGKLAQIQKLEVVLVTGHTDRARHRRLQPEAVGAPRRSGARLPGQQGCAEGQDRDDRHGREAAGPGLVANRRTSRRCIECLAPNRRVEVEAKGETTK